MKNIRPAQIAVKRRFFIFDKACREKNSTNEAANGYAVPLVIHARCPHALPHPVKKLLRWRRWPLQFIGMRRKVVIIIIQRGIARGEQRKLRLLPVGGKNKQRLGLGGQRGGDATHPVAKGLP